MKFVCKELNYLVESAATTKLFEQNIVESDFIQTVDGKLDKYLVRYSPREDIKKTINYTAKLVKNYMGKNGVEQKNMTMAELANQTGFVITNNWTDTASWIWNIAGISDLQSSYFFTVMTDSNIQLIAPRRTTASIFRGTLSEKDILLQMKINGTVNWKGEAAGSDYYINPISNEASIPASITVAEKKLALDKWIAKSNIVAFEMPASAIPGDWVLYNQVVFIILSKFKNGSKTAYSAVKESNATYALTTGTYDYLGSIPSSVKKYVDDRIPLGIREYLTATAASGTGFTTFYETSKTLPAASNFAVTPTTATELLRTYTTPAGNPGLLKFGAGIVHVHLYGKITNGTGTYKDIQLMARLYKKNIANPYTETQIGIDSNLSDMLTVTKHDADVDIQVSADVVLLSTDRLVLKIYAVSTGSAPKVNYDTVTLYAGSTDDAHFEYSVSQAYLDKYATIAPVDTWHNVGAAGEPAFANSWVNVDGGVWTLASFTKDNFGYVHIRGLIKSGTSIATTMFTLPAGYRPEKHITFVSKSNNAFGCGNILSNGTVQGTAGSTVDFGLDSIQPFIGV